MDVQQGIQVGDLLRIARRRAKLIVSIAGVVILAVYWLAMALPNQYTASSTILVEPQSIDEQLVHAGVRESDLKERLGIMSAQILSRARLSRLIDKHELYPEESLYMQRQEVIDVMRAHVSVAPVMSELEAETRNTRDIAFNTFKITFQSKSARTAKVVADSVAGDFIDANIDDRVKISQKSLDFMEDSIGSLRGRIAEVENAIQLIKSQNSGRLPEDLNANQRILQTTMSELREARQSLDLARSDQAFWQNQILAVASISKANDQTSPEFRHGIAQSTLSTLLSRGYTDKHPDIVQAKKELAIIEGEIRTRQEADAEEESSSYAEQNARSEQRRATLRAEANAAEVERLTAGLAEAEARIAATPAVAEQLSSREREYEHLFGSYKDFSTRRQQALVQANMERKQLGEQFRILEAAYEPPRPSSPNRMLILVLGVMLGGGLGIATGLVVESADTSLYQARDLQLLTDLPVLAMIPSIMLEPDRAARTRRQLREAAAALVVVLFCLLGGAMTYFLVNGGPNFLEGEAEEGEGETEAATEEQVSLRVPIGEGSRG